MGHRNVAIYTVDGRNPAPVDMANIPLFAGFYAFQVVVWESNEVAFI